MQLPKSGPRSRGPRFAGNTVSTAGSRRDITKYSKSIVTSVKSQFPSKYHNEGMISVFQSALQFLYNQYIWPLLPEPAHVNYNQVLVDSRPVFDHYVSWHTPSRDDDPEYEYTLIKGIKNNVIRGETVVIVGGEWEVPSVAAAQKASSPRKVLTFEGGEEYTVHCKRTIEFNGVKDFVDIENLVVGTANDIWSRSGTLQFLSVDELLTYDVLILDCEGMEVKILTETVIAETHGMHDALTSKIEMVLATLGYNVGSRETALRETQANFTGRMIPLHFKPSSIKILETNFPSIHE